MKTEITLEELLKQITPLPWPETSDHDDAPAFEHQPNWDYARHCANVLPELAQALKLVLASYGDNFEGLNPEPMALDFVGTGSFKDGAKDESRFIKTVIKPARQALSRAEKVTLP